MNNSFRMSLVAVVLIAAAGFAVYANSMHNEFVYDDALVIKDNVFLTKLSNVKYLFTKEYYAGSGEFTYRPILTLTYLINYHFSKDNPFGYHLTNIFFHVSVGVFVYFFILVLSPLLDAKLPARMVALLSGLFFVIHPIQTEVVNSAAFRDDAVFGFFFVPFLIFYLKAKAASNTKKALFYASSLICFFLACFSKELGLIGPFVLLLIDLCIWKKDAATKNARFSLGKKFLPYLGYIAIIAVFLYTFTIGLPNPAVSRRPGSQFNFQFYNTIVLMGSQYIVSYLRLLVFPVNLSVEYVFRHASSIMEPRVIFSIMALSALVLLVIARFKRDRLFAFSVLWILGFITPMIISPYQYIAERFLYLPCAGFCFLLGATVVRAYSVRRYRKIAVISVALIFLFYSWQTTARNMVWRNPLVFWEDRVRHLPATARAHSSLGSVYQKAGLYDKAETQFRKAVDNDPNYADAHNNLGNIYYERGLYDKADEEFKRANELNPALNKPHLNLGNMHFKAAGYDEAIEEYKIFLQQQPFDPEANNNLGRAYYMTGRYDDAISHFKKALEISPDFVDAWYNLGNAYAAKGMYAESADTYLKLLKKHPSYVMARNNLANLYLAGGRLDAAVEELKRAIETKPDFVEARYNLANIYYKRGLYDEAISEYKKAIEINPGFVGAYNNMGVVYLDKGMPDKAAECWEMALAIDPGNVQARQNLEVIRKSSK